MAAFGLRWVFVAARATLHCGALASYCGDFFVAEHGL